MTRDRGWTLCVEVLVFSEADGRIHFRLEVATVDSSVSPHDVAVQLAGVDTGDPAAFCHSTSWRVTDAGSITATYVALPDHAVTGGVPLGNGPIRAADDGLCRSPARSMRRTSRCMRYVTSRC
jgi:hypothetical protein